jgi:hypothetical protein
VLREEIIESLRNNAMQRVSVLDIGRWNPFGWNAIRHRPHFLMMWRSVAEWWERETVFGRRATGGFASILDVLSNEFHDGDIFLGRPKLIIGGLLRPIGIPTEKHMVTIAGTGSGKSNGALIPNLCIHTGSALVIDPKGELASITARGRGHGGGGVRGMGQDVYVLDPYGIVEGFTTASYNVFDEMEKVAKYDADRPVSYARKVAQAGFTGGVEPDRRDAGHAHRLAKQGLYIRRH